MELLTAVTIFQIFFYLRNGFGIYKLFTSVIISWEVVLCTDHDERSEKGNKQFMYFAQKYDAASKFEERSVLTMSWTSFQSLEVGAGSGSMSWL